MSVTHGQYHSTTVCDARPSVTVRARARPNFWQQGHGDTTEFMGHLQLYEASPNSGGPQHTPQHGMTLGQSNFARWPRVTGRPKFLQDPPCSPTLGGAWGDQNCDHNIGVRMSVSSWNISRPLQHVPNVDFFHCGMPQLCPRNWGHNATGAR